MTKRLIALVSVLVMIPFGVGNLTGFFVVPRIMRHYRKPAPTLKDKPPSTIKAGPFTWNVRFVKTGDAFGEIVYRPLELRIAPDLPPDQLKETMLHELLHASMFVGGGGTSGPVIHGEEMTDDQFIEAAAPTMLQIFRDNPELVAWLARK